MARKLRHIILGIFDKRQYMRLVYKYLPGKVFGEWIKPTNVIRYGHLYILKELQKQDKFCICYTWHANYAARYGYLNVLEYLYERNIRCSSFAYWEAKYTNNKNILQFLENYGFDNYDSDNDL